MSTSNDSQPYVLYKVRKLHHQAIDARTEGRYADQEAALREALEAVGPQDAPLPLWIKERYWLADALRMQGKYKKAMSQYRWLIDLAPDDGQKSDNSSFYYFAGAYIYFVECGRYAPDYFLTEEQVKLPKVEVVEGQEKAPQVEVAEAREKVCQEKISEKAVEALQNKLSEGLNWLKQIKKPDWWSAGLYLQWGLLLKNQGSHEEIEEARIELLKNAREKLQTALDYARESTDAPGYTFPTYQLELADLCCDIGLYTKAIDLAEEVLASEDSNVGERQQAYKILVYARLEKEDMAAMHFLPLKDQPLAAAIKSTETADNYTLKQLRLINEQLAHMTTAQYRATSPPITTGEQSTVQEAQPENPVDVQAQQPGTSVNEQVRDSSQVVSALSKSVLEQAMSINNLLQKQSAVQASSNTTHQASMLQRTPLPDSIGEKESIYSEHIVCLVALPLPLSSPEKDDKFHKVLLLALRQVLELKPYYWQVVCEDETTYENIEQLNFLTWLNRAQVYIADISSGSFKVMIELGAMLSARKPGQPLLVLKEENCGQDFAGMGDMVGMTFEYPSIGNKSDEFDVERVAAVLGKHFQNHERISELNKGKKAHYLSSLLFLPKNHELTSENIARKLSSEFTTMEAALEIDEAAFRHRAEANGLNPGVVKTARKIIMECLNRVESKGEKND